MSIAKFAEITQFLAVDLRLVDVDDCGEGGVAGDQIADAIIEIHCINALAIRRIVQPDFFVLRAFRTQVRITDKAKDQWRIHVVKSRRLESIADARRSAPANRKRQAITEQTSVRRAEIGIA